MGWYLDGDWDSASTPPGVFTTYLPIIMEQIARAINERRAQTLYVHLASGLKTTDLDYPSSGVSWGEFGLDPYPWPISEDLATTSTAPTAADFAGLVINGLCVRHLMSEFRTQVSALSTHFYKALGATPDDAEFLNLSADVTEWDSFDATRWWKAVNWVALRKALDLMVIARSVLKLQMTDNGECTILTIDDTAATAAIVAASSANTNVTVGDFYPSGALEDEGTAIFSRAIAAGQFPSHVSSPPAGLVIVPASSNPNAVIMGDALSAFTNLDLTNVTGIVLGAFNTNKTDAWNTSGNIPVWFRSIFEVVATRDTEPTISGGWVTDAGSLGQTDAAVQEYAPGSDHTVSIEFSGTTTLDTSAVIYSATIPLTDLVAHSAHILHIGITGPENNYDDPGAPWLENPTNFLNQPYYVYCARDITSLLTDQA
jgi:hypothetical protein